MPSAPAASPPPRAMAGSDPGVQFFGAADSQIFVRCYGNARHPAIFLLHDAPGSGLALESLARKLSRQYYVILPDLPGNGDSDAPMEDASILEAGAATGCGCAVAVTAARRRDPRLRSLFLEAPVAADAKKAAAIVPELHLSADGGHWIRAWLIARDNQIYKPWFDGSIASQRRAQGNFNAEWLHRQAFELMKARLSYHRLAQEAYGFDCLGAIAQIGVPVDVLEEGALAAFLLSAPSSA
jgi:pimeloyl-ACP methyl ester carboxylesterase